MVVIKGISRKSCQLLQEHRQTMDGWGVNAVVVATKTDEMELDSLYITVVPTIFQGQ